MLARKFSAAEIPDSALLYRRLFILCNIATGASRSTVKSAASAASASLDHALLCQVQPECHPF